MFVYCPMVPMKMTNKHTSDIILWLPARRDVDPTMYWFTGFVMGLGSMIRFGFALILS